ncbi:MAG TPA: hypothetical protein VD789_06760, partial [Thermomicrobiales bacterium]|nr:hypothetical protein [Thermomicrobiales bacterium]
YDVDVEYGAYDRPGVHVVAEAVYGDFQPFTGARFFGAQGCRRSDGRVLGYHSEKPVAPNASPALGACTISILVARPHTAIPPQSSGHRRAS